MFISVQLIIYFRMPTQCENTLESYSLVLYVVYNWYRYNDQMIKDAFVNDKTVSNNVTILLTMYNSYMFDSHQRSVSTH